MAFDMPESRTFSPHDSCQKRFLWTHKEVDLVLHSVVGFVLQVGNAEKFPHGRGFENLDPFFRVSKQDPCFSAIQDILVSRCFKPSQPRTIISGLRETSIRDI